MSEAVTAAPQVEPTLAPTPDRPHELRVLLGAQAGSRLPLSDGEYTVGSGDDCSLILVGPRIATRHATLLIASGTVQVRPDAGRVLDAQGRVLDQPTALAPGMPIEFDGVWLTIDHAEATWPDVRDLAAGFATAVPPATDAAATQPGPAAAARWPRRRMLRMVGIGLAVAALLSSAATVALGLLREKPSLPATADAANPADAGASAVDAIASAPGEPSSGASTAASSAASAAASAPPVPPAALTQVLQHLALDDVLTVSPQPGGAWRISGYIPTAKTKAALAKALQELQELQPPPDLQVYAQDEMIAAAQQALITADLPGSLHFAPGSSGSTLKLVGAARSEALADAAAMTAIRRVPGLHQLEGEVLLPEDLLARLKDELTTVGLNRRVTFAREFPEVVLTGKLVGDDLARWQTLYDKFRAAFGDTLPIQANVDGTPPVLPFVVQAVVGGPSPYLVTEDGTRVIRGGRIAGRTLIAIQNGELVFEGGERVRYTR